MRREIYNYLPKLMLSKIFSLPPEPQPHRCTGHFRPPMIQPLSTSHFLYLYNPDRLRTVTFLGLELADPSKVPATPPFCITFWLLAFPKPDRPRNPAVLLPMPELHAFSICFASLLAVFKRIWRGSFHVAQLCPSTSVVGLFGVSISRWIVGDVIGEIVPISTLWEQIRVDKVAKEINKEKGFLRLLVR